MHPNVGETERYLRKLFAKAKETAPCILLIDEIDSIGASRIHAENTTHPTSAYYINASVNQLLALLSEDNKGVVVVGTTNNYEKLDKALIRPGRIDRHIYMSLPSVKERKEILEIHTKDKRLSSSLSLSELAAISPGFSGAKLASWVNEAAINALREGSKDLESHHFDIARTLLEMGVSSSCDLDHISKTRVAQHESGHALINHFLNKKIFKVCLHQVGDSLGYTETIPEEHTNFIKSELLDMICINLAGKAAESLFNTQTTGSAIDIANAKSLAHKMVLEEGSSTILGNTEDIGNILELQFDRAKNLLKENKQILNNIINALMEHEILYKDDFIKVINGETLSKKNQKLTKKETISLPEKSKNILKLFDKKTKREFGIPNYSVGQIAKALNISEDKISSINIDDDNGFVIKLDPSVDLNTVEEKGMFLKKNDVDSFTIGNKIIIWKEGFSDFDALVKQANP